MNSPTQGSGAGLAQGGKRDAATLRWISAVAGRDIRAVWVMLAASVGQSLLGLAVAWMFGTVVDHAVAHQENAFWQAVVALAVLAAVQIALASCVRWLGEWSRSLLENRFRERVFDAACHSDLERVSSLHSGEWTMRMSSDARVVAEGVTGIVPGVAGMSVRMVGAIVMLIAIIPESAPFLLGGGVLLGILATLFRGRMKELHRRQQEAGGLVRSYTLECLQGLLVVHSFIKESLVGQRAEGLMGQHREARLRRTAFSNLCNTGFAAAMDGAYVLGVCYCGWRLMQGTMSYGTLTVVVQLVAQVQGPFANLSGYLPRYYAMVASAERLMELDTWPRMFSPAVLSVAEVRETYEKHLDSLRLSGLAFSYPSRESGNSETTGIPEPLSFPTLELRRGEALALTGRSGCGKSTLLKLLMGVYQPASGSRELVLDEGRRIPYGAEWRGLFAYVPQDDVLMSGTVRDVVSFGDDKSEANDLRIWDALRVACAWDFVRDLPHGLDTELGERGGGLSGGQAQRIAIARAVYSGHPVIVLDEATSALDQRTESQVLKNLCRLGNRTLVMVTHRPQAMATCDRRIDLGGWE